jgi:anthranilate synthase component 2
MKPSLVLLDNYDSYTYNLYQYLGELGATVEVLRNDAVTVEGIRARRPHGLVISPGPCTPNEAGVTLAAIKGLAGEIPILGECLGHQAIGQAFGGSVVRNHRIVHGKASSVFHGGEGVFEGLPSPIVAGRYHSLVIEKTSLPKELAVTGWTDQDEIMAVRHRSLDIEGVQFHPESILTEHGKALLATWLRRITRGRAGREAAPKSGLGAQHGVNGRPDGSRRRRERVH